MIEASNALALTGDDDQFLQNLNQATGHRSLVLPPSLKFDAQDGMWKRSTDQRTPDGKMVYQTLSDFIQIHIIRHRKMVQSTFKSKKDWFTKEFDGDFLELLDKDKTVIYRGPYSGIKNNPAIKELTQYVVVLYAFAGEEKPQLYRIKLTGSKLTSWFPYLNSFQNSNPAMFQTITGRGAEAENGGVKYYDLTFVKGEAVDKALVVERVNAVNDYLKAYAQATVTETVIANSVPAISVLSISEPPMPTEEPAIQVDEQGDQIIKPEEIPF